MNKTWILGTKYGIEQMAVNEQKTTLHDVNRVRSAICMYLKRKSLDWKFVTAIERNGGTRIIRIK